MNIIHAAAIAAFTLLSADAVTGNGIQHSNSVNGPWTYTSASGGWFYGGSETIYAWNREGVPVNFNGWLVYSPCNWHQAMSEVTLQPDAGLYNTGYGYQPTDRMLYAWCPAPQHPGIKCSTLGGGTTGRDMSVGDLMNELRRRGEMPMPEDGEEIRREAQVVADFPMNEDDKKIAWSLIERTADGRRPSHEALRSIAGSAYVLNFRTLGLIRMSRAAPLANTCRSCKKESKHAEKPPLSTLLRLL